MSSKTIAEDIRLRLAHSMPAVERRRSAIGEKMQERMQALQKADEGLGQAEVTSLLLVNLLIDGASDIAAFGALRDLSSAAREHRRLDIDGRHYSRFGLLLAPVLREVLGVSMPPKIASAWCDAFWLIIGQMTPDETQESRYLRHVRKR